MADIGAASGVAGLLSLTLDVVHVSAKYASAVLKANDTVLDLLATLTSLQQIFIQLQKQANDGELTGTVNVRPAALSTTAMGGCKTRLEDLVTTLQSRLNDEGHLRKRHALTWPFRNDQTKEVVASLGQYRDTFHAALSADILTIVVATHAKVVDIETDKRRYAIIEWLTLNKRLVPAMPDNEINVLKRFYAEPAFQDWLANPGKTLWCYGDAGCGKTVLYSIFCRDIATTFPLTNTAVIAHFYDYQAAETQSLDAVLRSMLVQAIETISSVPPDVQEMFADPSLSNKGPSKNQIKDELHKVFTAMSGAIILIDAFDECQHQREILSVLRSLAMEGISILVTSRDTPNIRQQFQQDMRLSIRPQDDDLQELVDDLELDQAFKQNMISKIVARSSGM